VRTCKKAKTGTLNRIYAQGTCQMPVGRSQKLGFNAETGLS